MEYCVLSQYLWGVVVREALWTVKSGMQTVGLGDLGMWGSKGGGGGGAPVCTIDCHARRMAPHTP
jgi:hypothetical protein